MAKRLLHVLLIYRKMIPSIRLCGHCQMEELARQTRVEYRARQEMKIQVADLNWADIVLLGRLDNRYELQLVEWLHKAKRYLMYILDDDLLHIPNNLYSADYLGKKETQDHIRRMIEFSDAIISPSRILLKKYAREGQKKILIDEPAINPTVFEEHGQGNAVKIGFAGSIDRTGDIEGILEEALKRIKTEYKDTVQFEFFGAIPQFAEEIGAESTPYCDSYEQYREGLNRRRWDIGLAPIPDTPFHACKHYNKFVEYAASGIVGIYSAHEPYLRLKRECGIGIFCENEPEAWYESLKYLIDNREERERMRSAACEYVSKELNVGISAERFISQFPEKRREKELIRLNSMDMLILKGMGIRDRGKELIGRYRWRIIPKIGHVAWKRCKKYYHVLLRLMRKREKHV